MKKWVAGVSAGLLACAVAAAGADTSKPEAIHWEMAGQLSEACTCHVPCSCNFGEGPSPKHYCWAMFSVAIEKGHYGPVQLDGLHLAGAHGKKGFVWYIDDRANSEQAAALRTIVKGILKTKEPVYSETAQITQVVGEKSNQLKIGDHGGFEADYITGMDGKTPVIVENNTSWNIQHDMKGKTRQLAYHDAHGNKYKFTATNSNQGQFDWTDQTAKYF